jgi:nitrile hydratase alpha subunit
MHNDHDRDTHRHDHGHDHNHDHDHSHAHDPHDHRAEPGHVVDDEASSLEAKAIMNALQELLIERHLLTADEVRQQIERMESPGIHLGARIVARAWTDPAFKQRLLADGKSAAAELGITVGEAHLQVVDNTPDRHNVIVCTLCSCYPRSILGQPPSWYYSKHFRARAVNEPRAVLKEFGVELPSSIEVQVHDSNADLRYIVLPMRPAGTDGWNEEQLAALVTRDSLVGCAIPAA